MRVEGNTFGPLLVSKNKSVVFQKKGWGVSMARGSISVDITNYDQVCKDLRKVPKDLAIGLKRFNTRLANRGIETVVRSEVTKVYNIKKGDVSKRSEHRKSQVQTLSLAGVGIPFYDVTFTGERLTPTHFGMTPKARPSAAPPFYYGRRMGRNYKVRWKPLRAGGRQVLPSDNGLPAFIAAAKGSEIAYSRTGPYPQPIVAIKRLSVPMMVENDKVAPNIQHELEKRIEKELARLMK